MNVEKEIEMILPKCLDKVEAGEKLKKVRDLDYVELPSEVKKVRARELAIELLGNKEFISLCNNLLKNKEDEKASKRLDEILDETFNNLRPLKPLKP